MELKREREILFAYNNRGDAYYDEADIATYIMKLESVLKRKLNNEQLEIYRQIKAEMLKLKKLEELHIIEFVLENE